MERRKYKRYDLRVPVLFSWTDAAGVDYQGAGSSLDITLAGIFVLCEEAAPPIFSPVKLQVLIPSLLTPGMRLQSSGTVMRIRGTPAYGFAAGLADFQLAGVTDSEPLQ